MTKSINKAEWVIPWLGTPISWDDEIKDRVHLIVVDWLWGIVWYTQAMNQDYYRQNEEKIHSLLSTK